MLTAGIRSTHAHDTKHHPLDQAHSPTATPTGALVYVVCGWDGCAQRLEMDAAVWEAEIERRRPLEAFLRGTWDGGGEHATPDAAMP